MTGGDDRAWDYVVVGSGAGGGTVAARLAELGHLVLLVEAGGDARTEAGERLPDDYDVPAFHAFASENPAMAWDFFVEHYADPERQKADPKRDERGILYPRASTLGGCTAHNAMIMVYPDAEDWRGIEEITGDPSWSPGRMRRWFRRLEDCRHRPWLRFLKALGVDYSGHGWNGWLSTEEAKPREAFTPQIVRLLNKTVWAATTGGPMALASLIDFLLGRADPNDRAEAAGHRTRVWYTPLTTDGGRRTGARERVEAVRQGSPLPSGGRLEVMTHALVTRVLFDDAGRALGVEALKGERLYRACPQPGEAAGERVALMARREVILAGGAFNTPQLLMLSGIGPSDALKPHGVPVRVDLRGVGRNLQDRYEVSVVNRMVQDWSVLAGGKFERGDPLWQVWDRERSGMYVSNGAAVATARRAPGSKGPRDLFFMALLANFRGYYPGYSKVIAAHHDYLSWTVLKGHTQNRGGVVSLRSADPRDPPLVNFHQFDEGTGDARADLDAVVHGLEFARRLAKPLHACGMIAEEEEPGPRYKTRAELEQYARDRAWGHHASCTCPIGPPEAGGVVDGDFRVHGVTGLRVVDASVFPRIPGSFIACAVYMIGEKAADAIHRDAAHERPPARAAAGSAAAATPKGAAHAPAPSA
ncbi:MAG TPA: GMC family oxidoreductase [Caulobacteraceae bacterium]|jgi:choline dehydrogenase-like flavoprotein